MQNELLQMAGQKSLIGNKHPGFNTVTGFEKSRFPLTILNIFRLFEVLYLGKVHSCLYPICHDPVAIYSLSAVQCIAD